VDSEGVKAKAVKAIENGMLANYLIGRQPDSDFSTSKWTWTRRAGKFSAGQAWCAAVKSSEAQSPEELKKKVIQMVTDQGKDYGLSSGNARAGNAPRLLYRVYAKDGHEELVRGAVFSELTSGR